MCVIHGGTHRGRILAALELARSRRVRLGEILVVTAAPQDFPGLACRHNEGPLTKADLQVGPEVRMLVLDRPTFARQAVGEWARWELARHGRAVVRLQEHLPGITGAWGVARCPTVPAEKVPGP